MVAYDIASVEAWVRFPSPAPIRVRMKIHEIISNQEQLDEINLRHAAAAGIMGASLMGSVHQAPKAPTQTTTQQQTHAPKQISQQRAAETRQKEETRLQTMKDNIVKKYKVKPELASQVVDLAHQYEDSTFPKATDLLALIGIESSFNPKAKSSLNKDPAVGLMQVRPSMWGIEPEDIDGIEEQIKHGARVLKTYYAKLGDKESAIKAYNIGLRGFRNSLNPDAADRYFAKYSNEYDNMYAAL